METVWSPYFTLNYNFISSHGIICYRQSSEQNESSTVLYFLLRYFLFQSSSSKLRMFPEKIAKKRRTLKLNCTAPVSRIHILKIANERSWSCTPMYNKYLRPLAMPYRRYGSSKTVTKKQKSCSQTLEWKQFWAFISHWITILYPVLASSVDNKG